jgi:integrase
MPRKSTSGLKHVKTVRRKGVEYLYFNTGQKKANKAVYTPLGRKDSPGIWDRYAQAQAMRTRRKNTPSVLTLPDLIRMYEQSPVFTTLAEGTQRTYRVYLKQLEYLFPAAPVSDIERRDIFAMVDKMGSRPAAAKMILLVAGIVFRWGKKREHVPHDPTAGVESEHQATEYEPWPEHLVEAGLADKSVRLPIALLYFTGQRIGDVCRLRWSDVRQATVFVTQQKTGKELEIPVHSELAKILAETPKRGITIITSARNKRASEQTVRLWLKTFGAKHGVEVVPHGLRKNAVNALIEAGCTTGEVGSITGQSLALIEHYARKRNNPRMAKAAILKMERKK